MQDATKSSTTSAGRPSSPDKEASTSSDQHQQHKAQDASSDQETSEKEPCRGAARKHHWKSQSVGESTTTSTSSSTSNVAQDITAEEEHTSFSVNRELWQRRATSQTTLASTNTSTSNNPTPKFFRSSQEFRKMRQKHTPDLVMDLPVSTEDSSKKTASTSSLSSESDEEGGGSDTRLRLEKPTPSPVGPESPDMSTAAERFAKQNQCTLKKNTKLEANGSGKQEACSESESEPEPTAEIVRSASSSQIIPPRSTPKIVAKFADLHLTGGSQVPLSGKPQVKVKPTMLARKPVVHAHAHNMSPELARKISEKQEHQAN